MVVQVNLIEFNSEQMKVGETNVVLPMVPESPYELLQQIDCNSHTVHVVTDNIEEIQLNDFPSLSDKKCIFHQGKIYQRTKKTLCVFDGTMRTEMLWWMNKFTVLSFQNPLEAPTINVVIKTLTGKNLELVVPISCTVYDLMEEILMSEGIPIDQQRVIFEGKQLTGYEEMTLINFGITNNSVIHLVLRLRGGMYLPPSSRDEFSALAYFPEPFLLNVAFECPHHPQGVMEISLPIDSSLFSLPQSLLSFKDQLFLTMKDHIDEVNELYRIIDEES